MNNSTIKIGTRGSKLALWQAEKVKEGIAKAFPDLSIEIIIIKTTGDIIQDVSLSKIGDKALFTKEIENALANGEIDLAVHSLKDLPTELPERLIIGGMLPRGEVRDVLISKHGKKLSEMSGNDKIATSSLRRTAQLLNLNPLLNVVDIRGNVDTRLQKMNNGYCDALIMAGAGILRLGYDELITEYLDPEIFLPAVSQGAIAVETREDDDNVREIVNTITDEYTWTVTMAERSFLRTLEGGCQVPVGCYVQKHGEKLKISGLLSDREGKNVIRQSLICNLEEASEKAIELAWSIIDKGGRKILDDLRNG